MDLFKNAMKGIGLGVLVVIGVVVAGAIFGLIGIGTISFLVMAGYSGPGVAILGILVPLALLVIGFITSLYVSDKR